MNWRYWNRLSETLSFALKRSTIFLIEYQDEIPFVNKAPIDQAETKKQQKQKDGQKKNQK